MNYEEIIQVAVSRPEPVWHWGDRLRSPVEVEKRKAIESMARELGATLLWGEPIRPGDLYLAIRNTGPHLLTCASLGNACVHPKEFPAYSFDFNECVKVSS